ncbi:MAG: hypothetical protein EXR78_02840 [Deltaproteobacteria bacterium]|nr:hypothetical protein [Deltaproteobacteria bacterium]
MSLLHEHIVTYAQEKRLSPQTLARWQAWSEEDQAALLVVVRVLQLGDNHLRDFLDWLEEITTRDGGTTRELLTRAEISQPLQNALSRNDKLKAVKEALRRLRYPRLSRLEEEVRAGVKALDLGNRIQLSFPPMLEGEEITVEIKARNLQELIDNLSRVQHRVADGSLLRLFALFDEV